MNYDADPEALAWAREKIQRSIDQARQFEREAAEAGKENSRQWRLVAYFMDTRLVGDGTGCVITAFDARRPDLMGFLR